MRKLRSAGMLTGGRNQPPLDLAAAAAFVATLGALLAGRPEITEIEVNPLALYRDGIAVLDCLITRKA